MKINLKTIWQDKKKFLLIAAAVLIVIIIAVIFLLRSNESPVPDNQGGENGTGKNLPAPEFLTEIEKEKFGLPAEIKAQALARDESGEISVYKIIRSDDDIILDPSAIGPISPRQK